MALTAAARLRMARAIQAVNTQLRMAAELSFAQNDLDEEERDEVFATASELENAWVELRTAEGWPG